MSVDALSCTCVAREAVRFWSADCMLTPCVDRAGACDCLGLPATATRFNFYVHRLLALTLELALGSLPTDEVEITTPGGYKFAGKKYASRIVGVTVSKAGT